VHFEERLQAPEARCTGFGEAMALSSTQLAVASRIQGSDGVLVYLYDFATRQMALVGEHPGTSSYIALLFAGDALVLGAGDQVDVLANTTEEVQFLGLGMVSSNAVPLEAAFELLPFHGVAFTGLIPGPSRADTPVDSPTNSSNNHSSSGPSSTRDQASTTAWLLPVVLGVVLLVAVGAAARGLHRRRKRLAAADGKLAAHSSNRGLLRALFQETSEEIQSLLHRPGTAVGEVLPLDWEVVKRFPGLDAETPSMHFFQLYAPEARALA
jgi:hypothetical protein